MSLALFFDLDGTLVDSEKYHWRAWREALLPFKIPLSWRMYREEGIGQPDPEFLRYLARKIPNGELAGMIQILNAKDRNFIRLVQNQSLLSNETLKLIREVSNRPLAVVTSSPRSATMAVLEGAGIACYFTAVVCLEDVRNPKPDAEPYLIAMKRLGVTTGIAFEDSASGRMSARAAGLHVVEVSGPRVLPASVRSNIGSSQPFERV